MVGRAPVVASQNGDKSPCRVGARRAAGRTAGPDAPYGHPDLVTVGLSLILALAHRIRGAAARTDLQTLALLGAVGGQGRCVRNMPDADIRRSAV
jgi:hypothetical protein